MYACPGALLVSSAGLPAPTNGEALHHAAVGLGSGRGQSFQGRVCSWLHSPDWPSLRIIAIYASVSSTSIFALAA
jgi:hypothetical protein